MSEAKKHINGKEKHHCSCDFDEQSHDHKDLHEDPEDSEKCDCDRPPKKHEKTTKDYCSCTSHEESHELQMKECGCGEIHESSKMGEYFEKHKKVFFSMAILFLISAIYLEFFTDLMLLSQLLALGTVLCSWWEVLDGAIYEIKERKIKANTLMIAAAIGSFFIQHGQEGATAILLYSLSEELESLIVERSKRSLADLIKLTPDITTVKHEGKFIQISTAEVRVGDVFLVKAGERVPLDGKVEVGSALVDKSALTGESELIETKQDDMVFAGTFLENGFLEIKATKVAGESAISNIVRLVEEAQKNKSETEKFIQRFATYYTPLILILSLSVMILAPLFFGLNLNEAIYRGLVLLVISCPCALTLSTPLGMVMGLSKLSKEGILVKGSKYIEELEKVQYFAFDKTGTLTTGKIEVKDFIPLTDKYETVDLLTIAGSIESKSEHNIAEAIVQFALNQHVSLQQIESFQILKGLGVKAELKGKHYIIGSPKFAESQGISIPKDEQSKYKLDKKPHIVFATLNPNELLGIFILSDKLRITAPYVLYELIERGYSTLILSGDNEETVKKIADSIYIQEKHGDLLPEKKLEKIQQYKNQSSGIVMIGDGINDAPSLSAANVGISFGDKATDIAVQTSDISILSNNLMKILVLMDVAKLTNKKIKQNIWISIIVKFSFAILTLFGLMNLWLAVGIGDIGVSLFIMGNGLLIFKYKNSYRMDDSLEKQHDFIETYCPNCETVNIIPNHHDKPLRPSGENLVCWMSEFDGEVACDYQESLICMKCHQKLILQ